MAKKTFFWDKTSITWDTPHSFFSFCLLHAFYSSLFMFITLLDVITAEPADKTSFVYNCMQTRRRGQYNGKLPISLVWVSNFRSWYVDSAEKGVYVNTTSTAARTSSENVISRFYNQLFKVITLEKCVQTIWELNWNQRFTDKKTKLNICHHMLTSSAQLENRSFHVAERTRTSAKCQKWKLLVQSVQN